MEDYFKFLWPSQNIWTLSMCVVRIITYLILLLSILNLITVAFQILSSSKFEYRFIGGGFNQSMRSEDKSNLSKVCRCSKDECFAKTAVCSQSVRAFWKFFNWKRLYLLINSFQPSENNFEMKVKNSYHRNRGATMHFCEARHSEGNIRALRKSQPLIRGDPSCWTDIRLHRRLTPNFGVSYFHIRSILKQNHMFAKISYEKQVFQC